MNQWCLIMWRKIIAVLYATFAVAKRKPEKKKNSGLYGIRTLDLCDTSAVLYQLSWQANWEQVVELVCYKPMKGWWWNYEYMKIIYVNCGVKNYLSYLCNLCSCEKKVLEKKMSKRCLNNPNHWPVLVWQLHRKIGEIKWTEVKLVSCWKLQTWSS